MAEFVAGTVVVPVVPSADDFIKTLKRQLLPGAYALGQELGKDIQRGIKSALTGVYDPLQEQTRRQRQQAPRDGEQVGGAFAQGFKRTVDAALKSLPKVDVDADTSPAQTRIQELRTRLETLSAKTIGIDIDAGPAQAELAAVQRELSAIDGDAVSVDVRADVASALARLGVVDAEASRVDGRTARVRVDADVAGALTGIAMVTAALAALPAAAAVSLGVAGVAGAAVAAGAGFAGLAAVAVPSLQRISEAAKQQEQAVKSSAGATTSAGAAAAQAALQAMQLEDAERRITDAKAAAKLAEEGLTEARRAAKQAVDDLARSVENAALGEESAALSVEEARDRLAKLQAESQKPGSGVTDLELRRADLSVREAEQRYEESVSRTKKLRQEQKAADKAGIEGSAQVKAAKDKITAANKQVEDAERQLKTVQLQQAAAAKQQASSTGGVTSQMVKLSPAASKAARQIDAFKNAYTAWQERLEPAVLPAVTGALKVLQGVFKPLEPLITGSAKAIVGLEKAASKALGGKFWTSFFADLSKQAPTAITGLGKALGGVGTGVAGLIKAFLPFVPTIVGGLQKAAGAFAQWGQGFGKSQAFQSFIAYAKANAPLLIEALKNVGKAVGSIISALAPFGPTALTGLAGLASLIAQLPPPVLAAIAGAIGSIVLAVRAWGIAQQVLNVAMSENPVGLIVAAIGLLVTAFVTAYTNSEDFRRVVDEAFKRISEVVSWAWTNVIQPALKALWNFIKTVLAPAISWLWENVIVPAWKGISAAVKTAWDTVILPALKALWTFITETLAPKISWLWENVIKPAWKGIGEAIDTAWTKVIKPAFDSLKTFITDTIPTAFDKGVGLIRDAWEKVKEYAKKPVNFIIGTVYNGGIVKLWNTVADALGLDLKLDKIPELATGGIMPGYTPGRDVSLAAVSGGEAIMRPEWTRAVGADYVHGANAAARSGGVAGAAKFVGGYADGGIIGDLLAKGVKAGAEQFLNPLLDQAAAAMGNSQWAKLLVGVPKKMVADVVNFLTAQDAKTGGLSGGKAVAYARAQIGKPYKWGATGPDSFDCSGLVMRALQAAGYTNVPRVTQDQINWVDRVDKPQPGYLGFPHSGHVWMYSGPKTIIEAPQTGLKVREVAARAAQVIGKPPAYDSGGYLMPGTSLVHNGTGRPEPVLTDRQWQNVSRNTSGGDGSLVTINGGFHTTPEQSPYAIARELRFVMGTGLRSRG
ncbi:NlpC/P60 family protein [Streptosporangium sp. NPDC051022]|uniref:NlpC/P60 family protein n=1 Tax=Streptosporangium sp. NPDC051022 TaxID=3155752 RepID=UPI003444EF07